MSSSDGVDELVQAVRNGQMQEVQRLVLSDGVDVNSKGIWDNAALTVACRFSTLEMVRWLIEEGGANVNVTCSLWNPGWTPLHVVSSNGCEVDREQKMRLLLKHNADVNLTGGEGETPLHLVCSNNDDEDVVVALACLLLEGGADVNRTNMDGRTPVLEACRRGHFSVLRLLVEQYGADIHVKDKYGVESFAVMFLGWLPCRMKVAQYLLEHGASVTAMDRYGHTALHQSVKCGHLEMTRLLLKHGADANQRYSDGSTMLHYCIRAFSSDDPTFATIMQVLLEGGANTKLANREGKVPFVAACEEGLVSAVYLLLQKGVGDGSIRFIRHRSRKRRPSCTSFLSVRRVAQKESCSAPC